MIESVRLHDDHKNVVVIIDEEGVTTQYLDESGTLTPGYVYTMYHSDKPVLLSDKRGL